MAWYSNKFSSQYDAAKKTLKSSAFNGDDKVFVSQLYALMTETGFDDSLATKLDDLRKKVTGKGKEDMATLEIAGYTSKSDSVSLAGADTRHKVSALKFLRHMYLHNKHGNHKVWIHSLPKAFNDWPHWALEAGTADAMKGLLRASDEQFSVEQKKHLAGATQEGLAWCQKTLMVLAGAAAKGDGTENGGGLDMVKRWFADEDTTEAELAGYVSRLSAGFKEIQGTINRGQIVFTDFPTLRGATTQAELNLLNSEAFVWPKGGREKLDVVYIENEFFGSKNVLSGLVNWTRILIHELSHLIVGTTDVEPGPRYAWYGIKPNKANFTAAEAMNNAENWAFFAADCAGRLSDGETKRALTKK